MLNYGNVKFIWENVLTKINLELNFKRWYSIGLNSDVYSIFNSHLPIPNNFGIKMSSVLQGVSIRITENYKIQGL